MGGGVSIVDSGNIMLDALLSTKAVEAQAQNISWQLKLDTPAEHPIFTLPICTMLANGLDNALEAATQATPKWIEVEITATHHALMVRMQNTTATPPIPNGHWLKNGFVSTKPDPDNHGLGIISMSQTIKAHGGNMNYRYNPPVFTLEMVVPL